MDTVDKNALIGALQQADWANLEQKDWPTHLWSAREIVLQRCGVHI
jgi:hypothetical protein